MGVINNGVEVVPGSKVGQEVSGDQGGKAEHDDTISATKKRHTLVGFL